jgi:hypothetical protein
MTRTDPHEMDVRLDEAERRIDEFASLAKEARVDTRIRVERRVKALGALTAKVHSNLSVSTWAEPGVRDEHLLDHLFEEIETQIEITWTLFELDAVDDRAAFEAAVERQIDAYRAYVRGLEVEAGDGGGGEPEAIVEAVRARTAAAAAQLQRFRDLSNEVSDSLRAGVLAALDDLDRAAMRASASTPGS